MAHSIVTRILPPPEFYAVTTAIDDSTGDSRYAPFLHEYLSTLESARIPFTSSLALESLPSGAFGAAYNRGTKFTMNTSEPLAKLSQPQRELLQAYLESRLNGLRAIAPLTEKYPGTLKS